MSIKVMSAILENSPSKAHKLLALLILGNNANDDGWAFPGQDDIAKHCRVTKRAIQNTLDALEDDGEILIFNRINPNSPEQHYSNCYHLAKYGKVDAPPPVELRGELHRRIRGSEAHYTTPETEGGNVADDTTPSEAHYTRVAKPATSDPLQEPSIEPSLLKDAPSGALPAGIEADIADKYADWVPGDQVPDEPPVTAYPCSAADINALITVWWDWVPKRPTRRAAVIPVKQHYANKTIRECAENLVKCGVMPADMAQLLGDVRTNPDSAYKHLIGKELPFNYVAEVLLEWVETDRAENWYTEHDPRFTPRKPGVTLRLNEMLSEHPLEAYANHPDFIVDVPRPYLSPQVLEADTTDSETSPEDDARLLAEMGIAL